MADVSFYRNPQLPFVEGKRCRADELAYYRHFHQEYSIGWIHSGRTNAWCDGKLWEVEQGRMISFPPQMLHACHPQPGLEWSYDMLFIDPDWLQRMEQRELEQIDIPYLLSARKNAVCTVQMEGTMAALIHEQEPLAVETELISLLQLLTDREQGDWEHHANGGQADRKYVGIVQDYLQAHFQRSVLLEELEQVTAISRFHLIRLFKRWQHLPPHAYQTLLRINYAKTELHRQRPIAEVATEAGFYDQSHFTRMFTRVVGVTPHRYKLSVI
ncbi:AraC family transcriptional regulator [Paenibacillus campi]|uniref:helix-turn-helix transcriptional regulator n=1 Tax=Paenibacillus campi TaxID=3106031 RepID=UPI002AFFBBBF|nr:AraC family transcriptional regulator [Paenibacillus sp. SGZ-1009]